MADVARYRFDERKLAWFARKVYTEHEMAYAMRSGTGPSGWRLLRREGSDA